MSEVPWIRFFASDWLGGTRGMSAAETGVYITLIATMYERGEPVPEDHARLARLCGASNSAFKAILDRLVSEGKIIRVEGGLSNERVEKERVYLSEKSEVGRYAANARWGTKPKKNNGTAHANAMPAQSERNAIPEARSQKKSEGANAPSSPEPEKPAPVAVIGLPTVSEGDFPIFESDIAEWAPAFPAVNVKQQLQAMRQWLLANQAKRKTKRGMRRFVVSWLDRKQNNGGSHVQATAPPQQRTMNDVLNEIIEGKPNGFTGPTVDASYERADRGSATGVVQLHAVAARNRPG